MKIRTISTRSLLSASLVSMSVLWLAGCGSGDDGTGVASGAGAHALGLADSGPAVREVHDYLMRYGYFPNDELSASFPTWSPAVDQAPESPTLFDDRMEQGVFAFQELSGLPRTGVVDEATANLMHTARCGVPDHVRSNNDKWAVDNVSWQQYGFTWSFNSSGQPSNLNTSDVLNSLTNMFARWSQRTGFIFTRQTSGGNIPITWAPLKSPSLGLTTCTYNKSTNRISVCKLQLSNADVSWSIGHPDGSQYDLESVALHEIGHAIGLDHSSQIPKPVPVPGFGPSLPVMVPGIPLGVVKSQLTLDDIEGVHALAKTLTVGALPNPPDGVGASSLLATPVGRVWALGSPTIGPGHRIWTFGSSGWTEHPFGGLATQLASTASGKLWAINSVGEIWTEGNGQWAKIDGAASHIAAAGNEVWHLSQAVTRGTKDHDIYRWNGSGWTQVAGYASEISAFIEPVFNTVQFWYVNGFGEVWGQGVFPDGTLGAPVALGKAPPGGACSPQASGRDGVFFALDCQQLASTGFSPPYVWNQQPQQKDAAGNETAPARGDFVRLGNDTVKGITQDTNGFLWMLNRAGQIVVSQ